MDPILKEQKPRMGRARREGDGSQEEWKLTFTLGVPILLSFWCVSLLIPIFDKGGGGNGVGVRRQGTVLN